ncbi:hypothetical protein R1flu_003068 [Riccia fluitans]|uniref:Small auxin up regulated protein n=1 Tax=Riccia fluitans TaxID=41844 RepID=A0ABD1Y851_9MARC
MYERNRSDRFREKGKGARRIVTLSEGNTQGVLNLLTAFQSSSVTEVKMVLGKMPRSTSKLVRRIQGLTSPKKSLADLSSSRRMSFSQLPESTQWALLTGRTGGQSKSSKLGRLPQDIPQGCLAVYVGYERRRYVISTNFLSHTLFKELLKRSEEEFGFDYEGGLNIACNCTLFESVLWMIATKDPAAVTTNPDELMDILESSY